MTAPSYNAKAHDYARMAERAWEMHGRYLHVFAWAKRALKTAVLSGDFSRTAWMARVALDALRSMAYWARSARLRNEARLAA